MVNIGDRRVTPPALALPDRQEPRIVETQKRADVMSPTRRAEVERACLCSRTDRPLYLRNGQEPLWSKER
jgi:hypothetical protein